jgi:hypothetical protein
MRGFEYLINAPASILGKRVLLLHSFGPTEACTLTTKDEAADALRRGWTKYRVLGSDEVQTAPRSVQTRETES